MDKELLPIICDYRYIINFHALIILFIDIIYEKCYILDVIKFIILCYICRFNYIQGEYNIRRAIYKCTSRNDEVLKLQLLYIWYLTYESWINQIIK